jgi:hypothetical protein
VDPDQQADITSLDTTLTTVERVLDVEATVIRAKHFLQEDQASAVADAVAAVARSG